VPSRLRMLIGTVQRAPQAPEKGASVKAILASAARSCCSSAATGSPGLACSAARCHPAHFGFAIRLETRVTRSWFKTSIAVRSARLHRSRPLRHPDQFKPLPGWAAATGGPLR